MDLDHVDTADTDPDPLDLLDDARTLGFAESESESKPSD